MFVLYSYICCESIFVAILCSKLRFLLRNTGVDSDFTQNFWGKNWRLGALGDTRIALFGENWEDWSWSSMHQIGTISPQSTLGEQSVPGEQEGHEGQALHWRLVASAPVLASRSFIYHVICPKYLFWPVPADFDILFVPSISFGWYLSAKHPVHMDTNRQAVRS